jgi:hypothetical protein
VTCYVYFIRPVGMDSPVKIGTSWDPESRLATLGTWSPLPLEIALKIPGGLDEEKYLHNHFAADHSHHEWFRASPELLSVMADLKAGLPLSDLVDTTVEASLIRRARYVGRSAKPEWHRQRKSYRLRFAFAQHKASIPGAGLTSIPRDCAAILNAWSADCIPTASDFARLDEVLSDPRRYFAEALQQGKAA